MKLALVLALAAAACGPTKPACSQPVLDAAETEYLYAVEQVAVTGICKKYAHAADCPELAKAKAKRDAASKEWEQCR